MAALDPKTVRTAATRRHYAQTMHRLLALAVYPAHLIERNPLPKGFLPKVSGNTKAKTFIYPDEDARLMAKTEIPLPRRLLFGVLAREGMREAEALALRFRDLDLKRGSVRLDENKTDDARTWVLDRGVARALHAWHALRVATLAQDSDGSSDDDIKRRVSDALVFEDLEGVPVSANRIADVFRADLDAADVKRPELFERSKNRLKVRVHDLRASFVTLSLANGKTEAWVSDRTGHKSSTMIHRYKRAARSAAELNLGALVPLDEALPEFRPTTDPTDAKGTEESVPPVPETPQEGPPDCLKDCLGNQPQRDQSPEQLQIPSNSAEEEGFEPPDSLHRRLISNQLP